MSCFLCNPCPHSPYILLIAKQRCASQLVTSASSMPFHAAFFSGPHLLCRSAHAAGCQRALLHRELNYRLRVHPRFRQMITIVIVIIYLNGGFRGSQSPGSRWSRIESVPLWCCCRSFEHGICRHSELRLLDRHKCGQRGRCECATWIPSTLSHTPTRPPARLSHTNYTSRPRARSDSPLSLALW